MKKFYALLAALVLALSAAAAVTAGPASAGFGPSYCNASTCMLSGGPTPNLAFFEMPRGSGVTMVCWTDSVRWAGTNRWFKVRTFWGNGYMNANQVARQTSVPHC